MKKLLLFSLILSTGAIQESQGAWVSRARSIGQKVRPFIVPGALFGSIVGTSIIGINAQEEAYEKSIAKDFEYFKDYDLGIPKERVSEIKKYFAEKGFSVALARMSECPFAPTMRVLKGENKEFILCINDKMLQLLSNKQEDGDKKFTEEMTNAILTHERAHVTNDDIKNEFKFKKLTTPVLPLAIIAGYKAMNALNIKNRFGRAIGLVAGGLFGYLTGSSICYFLILQHSQACESRADQAVFETKDPKKIKAFRDFFKLTKDDIISICTIGTIFLSGHPHPQERIDACDKALKQLEQQDAQSKHI